MNKLFSLALAFVAIASSRADFSPELNAVVPEPATVIGGVAIAGLVALKLLRRK